MKAADHCDVRKGNDMPRICVSHKTLARNRGKEMLPNKNLKALTKYKT